MSRVGNALQYRRLRSPQDHGGWLIDPPLADVSAILARNRESAAQCQLDFAGRSLSSLAVAARSHLLGAAVAHTGRYRSVPGALRDARGPIIMTGHQPELYHPGVWSKNFVLDRITRRQQAVGINLLIDNDTIRHPAIRVPTGSVAAPRVASVALDLPYEELPFEQRQLLDPGFFASFAERVRAALLDVIDRPLVEQLWPEAVAAARQGRNLGTCLSQARHALEAAWGLKTLEVPWSEVCGGEAFSWFVITILARLNRFQQVYNESLWEYRRVNRVRSRTHPAPALQSDGEWLEAPFWIWSATDPRRRRLFARHVERGIEITDRDTQQHCLPHASGGAHESAVECLCRLQERGIKIRSRALSTTMFARLFLCDLFIHGIGGAKYDQLTDAIIERFFGCSAPQFLTVTATAKLPVEHRQVANQVLLENQRRLRDLEFNPQRHLASSPEAAAFVEAKQRLIATPTQTDARRDRHLQFTQLNDAMQPHVAPERARLLRERRELIERARIARLLGSREYSFCLFPEATLRAFLLDI